MKLTKNYRVIDAETGEETEAFSDESFATPQDVSIKVHDAERRVSVALANQEIPDPGDKDLIDATRGKSFTIQEVITFN